MTFDERLAALQALFVHRAEIEKQVRELLGEAEIQITGTDETAKKRLGRKPKGKRKRLVQSDKDLILADVAAGKKNAEIVKQYGISYPTLIRIKRAAPSKRKVYEYRCLGCGHTFKSNLSKLDAYCPEPTCNKDTDIEEVTNQA